MVRVGILTLGPISVDIYTFESTAIFTYECKVLPNSVVPLNDAVKNTDKHVAYQIVGHNI